VSEAMAYRDEAAQSASDSLADANRAQSASSKANDALRNAEREAAAAQYSADAAANYLKETQAAAKSAAAELEDIGNAASGEISANGEAAVNAVKDAESSALASIKSAENSALGSIDTAETAALSEIGTTAADATAELSSGLTAALEDVGNAKDSAVTEVTDAGGTAVSAVTEARGGALGDIETARNAAVSDVNEAADERVAEINAMGVDGTVRFDENQALTALQQVTARSNIGAGGAIVETAQGDGAVTVNDSAEAALHGLRIFGKSTQGGTPSPDSPVPIVSVGDDGAVDVYVTRKNLLGGDALRDVLLKIPESTWDAENRIVSYNANNTPGSMFMKSFKANTRYTLIFTARKSSGTGLNVSLHYTDGSVAYLNMPETAKSTLVYVTVAGKSVDYIRGINSAGTTYMYVDECGVFEGVLTADDFESYDGQTLSISTPNGLPGIPVDSGGNYTDADGQQWICDEVDFVRGVYVQRVNTLEFSGAENWQTTGDIPFAHCTYSPIIDDSHRKKILFSHGVYTYISEGNASIGVELYKSAILRLRTGHETSVDDIKSFISNEYNKGTPLTVAYILATPIETPLTEEQLAVYRALRTQYPTTNVINDEGTGMEISYTADTKTYIDNKFAELSAAILDSNA